MSPCVGRSNVPPRTLYRIKCVLAVIYFAVKNKMATRTSRVKNSCAKLASSPGHHEEKRAWYPLRVHAQFHQVFLVLGYLCNPLRIILWYTSGYFPCYAIPKRWRPRWRHFAVLLTSEAHKRSEQTRSSSYLHTNSPDTCTVKNACGFTACYPENLLSYLAHAHAVDTRPSFLREGLGTRLARSLQASLTQDTDRSRPTGEGASRRPYTEAHAQIVPTALSTFQGSPTASRKCPAIVYCIRRVSEERERKKDSGELDQCARCLPST